MKLSRFLNPSLHEKTGVIISITGLKSNQRICYDNSMEQWHVETSESEVSNTAARVGETVLRIFLSPTRSGSTALLRSFENNPSVDQVFHQPIKSGYRQDGTFDYSFFDLEQKDRGHLFVAKETVGGFAVPETIFSPLPNFGEHEQVGPWLASPSEITKLEPLILIRDPLQTWASIERLNRYSEGISEFHSPFEYFEASYRKVAEFLIAAKARELPVHCVTQEMLGQDPVNIMSRICDKWDMPWSESMIFWDKPYGVKTWFSNEAKTRMLTDPRFKRSKESLEASTRYDYNPSVVDDIAPWQVETIETGLRPLYEVAVSYARKDFFGDHIT